MKGLIAFLLIAAVTAGTTNTQLINSAEDPIIEFVKGLLSGLGETKSADDLMKCIKDAEFIIEDIYEAFMLIKTMEINNIIKGVNKIIEALRNFTDMIKPCTAGYLIVQKLINAIVHINFNELLKKLLNKAIVLIGYITGAITSFKEKEYRDAGRNVGWFLKALILDPATGLASNNSIQFVLGFLNTLGDKPDIKDIEPCINDVDHIIEAVKVLLEKLQTKDVKEIFNAFKNLAGYVIVFVKDLGNCCQNLTNLKKLISAIENANIFEIVIKIVRNLQSIIKICQDLIQAFASANYHEAGVEFAKLLIIAYL